MFRALKHDGDLWKDKLFGVFGDVHSIIMAEKLPSLGGILNSFRLFVNSYHLYSKGSWLSLPISSNLMRVILMKILTQEDLEKFKELGVEHSKRVDAGNSTILYIV